jgi:hypothetical protein
LSSSESESFLLFLGLSLNRLRHFPNPNEGKAHGALIGRKSQVMGAYLHAISAPSSRERWSSREGRNWWQESIIVV